VKQLYVFIVSFVAAVGGFLFGFDLSIISGASLIMEKQFELDPAPLVRLFPATPVERPWS